MTKVYAFDPLNKEKIYGVINIVDNSFVIKVKELKEYIVFVEEPGKLGNSLKFTKEEINGKVDKNKKLELISYKSGNRISFRNVNFQSGKSILLPESYEELDKVALFLLDKSNLKIEIVGHTDDVGGDVENIILSKERAESVSYYLMAKGINKNAFTIKGLGEGMPLNKGTDEKSRYLNRRVEFYLK